ncbi:hypothetical protein B0H14DRAFT_2625781 [Mycena olivaceomarginata]|nr:hypothetical protein B0H14DRAFT_2625781 [Mycena olivaceomarginata]
MFATAPPPPQRLRRIFTPAMFRWWTAAHLCFKIISLMLEWIWIIIVDARSDSDSPAKDFEAAKISLEVLELQPKNKKILLLCIFYLAFFLDTFNNSSLFTAIPLISAQLNISDSQSVWLLGAYQLTFAALLLISGRVSDLYNPSGALTIPSALHLIVYMYPDPVEQAKAVTAFSGMRATESCHDVFSNRADFCTQTSTHGFRISGGEDLRFRRLDLLGVFMFTGKQDYG